MSSSGFPMHPHRRVLMHICMHHTHTHRDTQFININLSIIVYRCKLYYLDIFSKYYYILVQSWQCTPINSACRSLRQKVHEYKASFRNTVRPCFTKKKHPFNFLIKKSYKITNNRSQNNGDKI